MRASTPNEGWPGEIYHNYPDYYNLFLRENIKASLLFFLNCSLWLFPSLQPFWAKERQRGKKIFDSLIPNSGKGWEEHGTVLFWHPVPLSQWITQGPILNFESGRGTLLWHGPAGLGVFLSYPNTFNWLNCINQRAWKPAQWGKPRRCNGMFDRGLLLN